MVSPDGARYATAMQNVYGIKLLEDGYCIVMLDGCHCRHSIDMIQDEDGME